MKLKMSIRLKMLVFTLTTSVIVFGATFGYLWYRTSQQAFKDAEKLVLEVTKENAILIEKDLSENLTTLKTLAQAFRIYKDMPEEQWKSQFIDMYYEVFKHNDDFYKLWDSWELQHFDSTWTKDYGRYAVVVSKVGGYTKHTTSMRSMDGDSELYAKIKSLSIDMLWEPYWDEFTDLNEEKKFMTSLSSPILYNNQFAGIVAADIIMDKFQSTVENIKPYTGSKAFLSSNQGVIVGHFNHENIGKNINDIYPEFEQEFKISKLIKNGDQGTFLGIDNNGDDILVAISPITIGESETPWSIGIIVPKKIILADSKKIQSVSIIVAIIGLLIISFIVIIIAKLISNPLNKTTEFLQKLAVGEITNMDLEINTGDEIEDMANSAMQAIKGLQKTSEFANEIGNGNLKSEFQPLGDNDSLGISLLEMRKSLLHAKEEEDKRLIEEEKRNWSTQGIAKFSDILRANTDDIKKLGFNIISNLVDYVEANQGALFIIDTTDDTDLKLELISAIAYDREKFINKTIRIGEELVGRCAFEMQSIYMTDIPQNYIKITSGMGTANPTSLLLVPLILNDEIFGVIELASFKKFEKYQIDFIERIGESIASTIASVKVNERTSKLLNQSKLQTEELAAQEEEMRQNMEELQATQEESQRREYEMNGIINALSASALTVEYDMHGNIQNVNKKYTDLLGVNPEQIIGKNHADGYDVGEDKEKHALLWSNLRKGIPQTEVSKVVYNKKEFWLSENYTPVSVAEGEAPSKVVKISFDITEQKELEAKLNASSLNQDSSGISPDKLAAEVEQRQMAEKEIELLKKQIAEYKNKAETPIKEDNSTNITSEADKPAEKVDEAYELNINWDDSYILGINELDQQHEQLTNLANILFSSFSNNKSKKDNKDALRNLIDFASYHFGTEEQYFEQFNFELADDHIAEHKLFLKKMKDFQTEYSSSKRKDWNETLRFIKEWLTQHIKEVDKKYKDILRNK